jgi:GAF domain-containing protein
MMTKTPPKPENEAARLEALCQYRLLDTPPEQAFDDITTLASTICEAPVAIMTLVDGDRQWFKSKIGLRLTETPRDHAFCAYTILQPDTLVVEDATKDERFAWNPLVTMEPHIRFYAGAPLRNPQGHGLGSLCVIDQKPRQLTAAQQASLEALARMAVNTMELRRVSHQLANALANVKTLSGLLPICSYCHGIRDDQGYWQRVEAYIAEHTSAAFTHGICPTCARQHFPDVDLTPLGA